MNWMIQAVNPTLAADLKKVLEASRDHWVATTPQESDQEAKDAEASIHAIKDEKRALAAKTHATIVRNNNAKALDAQHAGIVAQMDRAIAAAVLLAAGSAAPKRVTLTGHFKPGHIQGIDERFNISLDDAQHG